MRDVYEVHQQHTGEGKKKASTHGGITEKASAATGGRQPMTSRFMRRKKKNPRNTPKRSPFLHPPPRNARTKRFESALPSPLAMQRGSGRAPLAARSQSQVRSLLDMPSSGAHPGLGGRLDDDGSSAGASVLQPLTARRTTSEEAAVREHGGTAEAGMVNVVAGTTAGRSAVATTRAADGTTISASGSAAARDLVPGRTAATLLQAPLQPEAAADASSSAEERRRAIREGKRRVGAEGARGDGKAEQEGSQSSRPEAIKRRPPPPDDTVISLKRESWPDLADSGPSPTGRIKVKVLQGERSASKLITTHVLLFSCT